MSFGRKGTFGARSPCQLSAPCYYFVLIVGEHKIDYFSELAYRHIFYHYYPPPPSLSLNSSKTCTLGWPRKMCVWGWPWTSDFSASPKCSDYRCVFPCLVYAIRAIKGPDDTAQVPNHLNYIPLCHHGSCVLEQASGLHWAPESYHRVRCLSNTCWLGEIKNQNCKVKWHWKRPWRIT